ncbi:MAG: 1-deoxy-D-xylulose-5-phosphate synthase [Lachnospiraceae bacterium]|nr:1-deoxy-D-xylulose-5-phosphate synthase [Candidatus Colinaster scatohippi]
MILEKISGPSDVSELNLGELELLAEEVREALIYRLSESGGHVGSNLGVVELTVALHYVFDSPKDKLIWDVSHQCYAHKMLTGRRQAYTDKAHFGDVTGFTNIEESEHDHFTVGHTATSISLALGMAKARDISGKKENIIAIIGDGAMSGGEAYEALNYAGEYDKNLIIILNDNNQSIGENHGGLYAKLTELRNTAGQSLDNVFRGLNLDYMYLDEGHNVEKLVDTLKKVKDIDHPVVLHVHTTKGKGLPYSEANKEDWHSSGPFNVKDGSSKNGIPNYDMTIHDSIIDLYNRDSTAVVISAATPRAMGFVGDERADYIEKGRFVDVGIAEENAMAMASGMAKYGITAVFGAYGTFLQRTYDQLIHDLCLNNSPATILVLMPGAYGMKSNTHFSMCDIQMFSHVPNLVYLSPAYKEEYQASFKYATMQKEHPVAIRVPNRFYECGYKDNTDYSLINKAKIMREGSGAAIIAVGALIPKALEMADECVEKLGIDITVINPVFLSGIDVELLEKLKENHDLVITMEDGILDGGYGTAIAGYYGDSAMKVITLGITKEFHSNFNTEELLNACGISTEKVLEIIKGNLKL